jgi:hypothetical protein
LNPFPSSCVSSWAQRCTKEWLQASSHAPPWVFRKYLVRSYGRSRMSRGQCREREKPWKVAQILSKGDKERLKDIKLNTLASCVLPLSHLIHFLSERLKEINLSRACLQCWNSTYSVSKKTCISPYVKELHVNCEMRLWEDWVFFLNLRGLRWTKIICR